MTCDVQVLAHSRNPTGVTITTLQLRYWRAIHGEVMTHRVFSRNASSSRAVPVKTTLSQVWNDPAGPIHWGANQSGMQASTQLQGGRLWAAKALWKGAGRLMCIMAWLLMHLGLHKQVANRLLEPWQYIHVVVTATDWDNFFDLRDHPDAQPEMMELAQAMFMAMSSATPVKLRAGQWHLPYVRQIEHDAVDPGHVFPSKGCFPRSLLDLIKLSVARCARTSYITHGDTDPSVPKDYKLYDRLVGSTPLHASPTEHQAMALESDERIKNFRGFHQFRDMLEKGLCPDTLAESLCPRGIAA
jgi:hypothetical protein